MTDGQRARDWSSVCLTPGTKLRDLKHARPDELTREFSKSDTISATSRWPRGLVKANPSSRSSS